MYKDQKIAVVVPAYNEEAFIGKVISTMPDFVDRIVVVDDCSRDRTGVVAGETAAAADRVSVLKTPARQGVGGATKLGYRKALELEADIVVKMDGDGQMDPRRLPALLDAIVDTPCDYAKGNRFLLTLDLAAMPRLRLLGNIALNFLTKFASGYWQIFDPQNGFTAIRASALKILNLDRIHQGFFFENDMLVHLNIIHARVKDVALPARYGDERSHLSIMKVLFTFPFLLLRRSAYRFFQKYVLRDFSPIALFLGLGLVLCVWGVLFGGYWWAHSVRTGIATPTGTIMLALLPLILGFQLVLQAIVLDIHESPRC